VETLDEINKTDEDEEVNSDEFEAADWNGVDSDEVSDQEDGGSSHSSKRYSDEDDLLPIEKAAKKLNKRYKRDE
jgi:hypothetical protein